MKISAPTSRIKCQPEYPNMTPRFSRHFSIFDLVFFVLKSLLGSNPIWGSDFSVLLWLILYISLYFLYNGIVKSYIGNFVPKASESC